MDYKQVVWSRIESLLKAKKKTATDLCRFLGISTNSASEWRSGRNASFMKQLDRIAVYLDVSEKALLGEGLATDTSANDDELLEIMNAVHKRPELRVLFSASKNATKDDILRTVKIIESLKGFDNE